jgi:hypothetical protein
VTHKHKPERSRAAAYPTCDERPGTTRPWGGNDVVAFPLQHFRSQAPAFECLSHHLRCQPQACGTRRQRRRTAGHATSGRLLAAGISSLSSA